MGRPGRLCEWIRSAASTGEDHGPARSRGARRLGRARGSGGHASAQVAEGGVDRADLGEEPMELLEADLARAVAA